MTLISEFHSSNRGEREGGWHRERKREGERRRKGGRERETKREGGRDGGRGWKMEGGRRREKGREGELIHCSATVTLWSSENCLC